MPQISASVTINSPISNVYRVVADFKNADKWQPDVVETHLSDEKLRVGVFFTQVRHTFVMGWQLDLNADIINMTPNRLIEYKGVVGRFPALGRIEFESSGGSTIIRENINVRMGFLFGIFSPLMKRAMTRRTVKAQQKLKQVLESARGEPTSFHEEL